MPRQYLPYIVPLIVVALIALRLARASKPRKIKPNRLWTGPLYVLVGMAAVFANPLLGNPLSSPFAIPLYIGAAAIGAGLGYLRALHQEFSIDPETGAVMSKASPVALILFFGVFLVRFGLNQWMGAGSQTAMAGKVPSANLVLYTDAMLFFAFGMVSATAWEVWRRTRPLVTAQRSGEVSSG